MVKTVSIMNFVMINCKQKFSCVKIFVNLSVINEIGIGFVVIDIIVPKTHGVSYLTICIVWSSS